MNIQKYSIHDGPGIRTTVFLKGCPLNCWWCHNPESQLNNCEIMFWKDKCKLCGACIKVCPQGAIEIKDNKLITDKNKCNVCEKCVDFCIHNAREIVGQKMNTSQLMKEIQKDEVFYNESGGGVTFSGGEPLQQHEFLSYMLDECRKKGIHTAVDTSGFTSWDILSKIADKTDLFLYDIKHMDDDKHKKYTGVSNKIILDNLKKLSLRHNNISVRMPIIPDINDDYENLNRTKEFLSTINVTQINLLPYHKIGIDKYNRIFKEYKLLNIEEPSKEKMSEILKSFCELGIKVKIGGYFI
nr:trans-4-hydroxy-L-proline dehydratase activase [Clostridium tepidiprofundi]